MNERDHALGSLSFKPLLDTSRGIPVSPLLREPHETYQQARDRLAKSREGRAS